MIIRFFSFFDRSQRVSKEETETQRESHTDIEQKSTNNNSISGGFGHSKPDRGRAGMRSGHARDGQKLAWELGTVNFPGGML